MKYDNSILIKWSSLIEACKRYYVDALPTGMLDSEYDELEKRAILEDGFYVRNYVFESFLDGTKYKNHGVDKIKKIKISSNSSMIDYFKDLGNDKYFSPKYDGVSLAIYLDPKKGKPVRVVTVGNLNLNDFGVDQTYKLMGHLPQRFPLGISIVHAECLIDLDKLSESNKEKARQLVTGILGRKEVTSDIVDYLTIRAFRYFYDSGVNFKVTPDYREVLRSFEIVRTMAGDILFAPADIYNYEQTSGYRDYFGLEQIKTTTGTFLVDGWVSYSESGLCLGAFKFPGAGTGEIIKSTVKGIRWNSQISKGKDSWSANVIIDPIKLRGVTITKPSAGSVGKLIRKNISLGAEVSIILANSTIPMIGECLKPGNGDFEWPTCGCGVRLGKDDIYGSHLMCGNQDCTEKLKRMSKIGKLDNEEDLDKYLPIDRFTFVGSGISIDEIKKINNVPELFAYISGYLKTDLQKKILWLMVKALLISLQVLK